MQLFLVRLLELLAGRPYFRFGAVGLTVGLAIGGAMSMASEVALSKAPRYFFLLDNLSKKPDSRALVDDPLTLLHRPRYPELPPFRTHCYPRRRPIPSRSHLPAPSW